MNKYLVELTTINQAIKDFNSIKNGIESHNIVITENTPTSEYENLIRNIVGEHSGTLLVHDTISMIDDENILISPTNTMFENITSIEDSVEIIVE